MFQSKKIADENEILPIILKKDCHTDWGLLRNPFKNI